MTLDEMRSLKKGDAVYINLGNGWRQHMTFVKTATITHLGTFTLSDILQFHMDTNSGKETLEAVCEYVDDRGIRRENYFKARRLHKA